MSEACPERSRRAGPERKSKGRRVTLFTKGECGLCAEAEELLRRLQKRIRFQLEIVDIQEDMAIYDRYKDRVPVVAVDGKEVAAAPIDGRRLAAAVSAP